MMDFIVKQQEILEARWDKMMMALQYVLVTEGLLYSRVQYAGEDLCVLSSY
jgi:hypothetical protein